MDLNLDELESAPARKSGRGGFVMLLIGIALGVAGMLFLPRYVVPMLPESLRGGGEQVDGVVLAMGRDGDKLLLTVDTQKGAVLATFTRRVAEVELLVRMGDTLTLGMDRYDPFVSDPAIAAVRKNRDMADATAAESVTDTLPAAGDSDGLRPQADMDTQEDEALPPDTAQVREPAEPDAAEADTTRPDADAMAEEAGAATG